MHCLAKVWQLLYDHVNRIEFRSEVQHKMQIIKKQDREYYVNLI